MSVATLWLVISMGRLSADAQGCRFGNWIVEGRTCLITGGADGIGYAAARELARLGANVVIADRHATDTATAVDRIVEETGNRTVRYLLADLSSQEDVRTLADQAMDEIPRLNVLVNNVGAVFLTGRQSPDGIEKTFALNHLGPFLLTTLLLELLQDSAPSRIVNVSSSHHTAVGRFRLEDLPNPRRSGGYRTYARSKLCNILFTYELARRLGDSSVTVNALHPGLVRTSIARNNGLVGRAVNSLIGVLGVDPAEGAKTLIYLATSPEVERLTGKYFVGCGAKQSSPLSYETGLASDLWEMSERLTKPKTRPEAE